jgi:hypothetical protein
MIEQRRDRAFHAGEPVDIAAERTEAATHVDLVGLAVAHHADGREGLEAGPTAEFGGRRVIGHAIVGLHAPQGRGLPVADLHEPGGAAAADMLRRGNGNPVPAH